MDREDRFNADALIASGGWYGPVFDENLIVTHFPRIELPEMSATRGGIDFTDHRSDAERAADEAMQSHIARLVQRMRDREYALIEHACLVAQINGWDLHIYRAPYRWSVGRYAHESMSALRSAYIGIGYAEAKHGIPTLHEHEDHDVSELDDDEWFPPR
jgi:hypothetical protein